MSKAGYDFYFINKDTSGNDLLRPIAILNTTSFRCHINIEFELHRINIEANYVLQGSNVKTSLFFSHSPLCIPS